ncbi:MULTISPECIES: spore germination protein [Bacillus]|uniref:Spore germination protein A1 n=1 Tax=Bacillus paralicheniformis TaxID=1648923 RepID=A0ABY3FVU0_9BACI|nr:MULTISPECIES: spore germination protein [Bacillus]ETB70877.1 spore germination protein [Bacillus sp. CPSM8]KUL17310.1 spore germination protein [Bacillus licheniformis LMG 6934]MBC8623864.1 spore germination protein [Robertmurraya crescens]AJO17502.1 spore germination protein [Bacillus paralicheniformis]ARA85086.1 spore germination protein [Bacillus paralicheniformis]
MFRKYKRKGAGLRSAPITKDALLDATAGMADAVIEEHETKGGQKAVFYYLHTIIDRVMLQQSIIRPLIMSAEEESIYRCLKTFVLHVEPIVSLETAKEWLMSGSIIIHDPDRQQWFAIPIENRVGRQIEPSQTETVMYGPKDSFTEQLDVNLSLLRRRLPLTNLKAERLTVCSLSKTSVVIVYIAGLTNPELIEEARKKIAETDFDMIFDSAQLTELIEDHHHSIFPQFQQTERPDISAYNLSIGKVAILVDQTPFVLHAPITFFHLFHSAEDYTTRWPVASFFRMLRYASFFLSILLIPFYVALSTHHYHMFPLQILYVLIESRSKVPFTPFWEAVLMLLVIEIIKEASVRMPTKSSSTLGVISGIVIGEAAVQAGFVSKVLIVLVGISTVASFLVPNYIVAKGHTLIHFTMLVFSACLGFFGLIFGMIGLFVHLNGLTSLKQPYFAPITPLYWRDWLDLFIRSPLIWLKKRPEYLHTLQKWRYVKRR